MMHYAWIIASTGTLVLLLTQGFGRMSYSVILPSMKDGLVLTYTQIGLIGTANFIGYLSLAVVGGFLAVRSRTRRTDGSKSSQEPLYGPLSSLPQSRS